MLCLLWGKVKVWLLWFCYNCPVPWQDGAMCVKASWYLIEVIHKHLAHFVDRNGCVDGAIQPQLPHSVRQSAKVNRVRVREQHSINLMDVSAWGKTPCVKLQIWHGNAPVHKTRTEPLPFHGFNDVHRKVLIPATVQEKAELIHLQEVTEGRLLLDPWHGCQLDNRRHLRLSATLETQVFILLFDYKLREYHFYIHNRWH